jgi:hypothetical protein
MTETTAPATGPTASPWKAAFSSRGFLLVVGVLALAAVGLNTVAEALEVYFKKEPVPLRHRLDDAQSGVPREMGAWVAVHQTSSLREDVQEALGTREFVFRTYVDSRIAGRELVQKLITLGQEMEALDVEDKAQARARLLKQNEWHSLLRRLQVVHPEAVMSFNVTYYTGIVDTVTHVPDVCMVADGYQPKDPQTLTVTAGQYPDGAPREIQIQVSTFEDQTGHGRVSRNVAYVFHCNGGYEASPVGVRGKLQNLFERHGYYAKVELMTDEPVKHGAPPGTGKGPQKPIEAMTDMLAVTLPEVERCLPDWNQLKGKAQTAVAQK